MNTVLNIDMVRCAHCGHIDAATRSICSNCLGTSLQPHQIPGTGKLVSWTTIRRAPAHLRSETPYHVCVVDLDAGQRVSGRLETQGPLEDVQLGARVALASSQDNTHRFELIQEITSL